MKITFLVARLQSHHALMYKDKRIRTDIWGHSAKRKTALFFRHTAKAGVDVQLARLDQRLSPNHRTDPLDHLPAPLVMIIFDGRGLKISDIKGIMCTGRDPIVLVLDVELKTKVTFFLRSDRVNRRVYVLVLASYIVLLPTVSVFASYIVLLPTVCVFASYIVLLPTASVFASYIVLFPTMSVFASFIVLLPTVSCGRGDSSARPVLISPIVPKAPDQSRLAICLRHRHLLNATPIASPHQFLKQTTVAAGRYFENRKHPFLGVLVQVVHSRDQMVCTHHYRGRGRVRYCRRRHLQHIPRIVPKSDIYVAVSALDGPTLSS